VPASFFRPFSSALSSDTFRTTSFIELSLGKFFSLPYGCFKSRLSFFASLFPACLLADTFSSQQSRGPVFFCGAIPPWFAGRTFEFSYHPLEASQERLFLSAIPLTSVGPSGCLFFFRLISPTCCSSPSEPRAQGFLLGLSSLTT